MGFALFLLLNAILFIRPAELMESLQPFRLYQLVILACLATSYPQILKQLDLKSLTRRPITACIVGILVIIVLSHLRHGSIYDARTSGFEFFKIVLYFLLLVASVDTPVRFQQFLNWFVVFTAAAASLALLQFYEFIDILALAAYEQREVDQLTGEIIVFPRLCSTGIFNDPNDVCLILSAAMMVCLYRILRPGAGPKRFVWFVPIALFMLAFIETKSRGGFLSLMTALGILMLSRLGPKKTAFTTVLLSPALIVFGGGRMTNIDVADGTGQHRIQLWREALAMLRDYPIFGCGQGMLPEYTRLVAHNSYVHAFAELGILGGSCFISLVYLTISQLSRLRLHEDLISNKEMRRFRPYLLGIVCGFCMGIMTLSRVYIVPTYMIFGLAMAFLAQIETKLVPKSVAPRLDATLMCKLALVSMTALVGLEFGSRLLVRWEG